MHNRLWRNENASRTKMHFYGGGMHSLARSKRRNGAGKRRKIDTNDNNRI